MGRKTLVLSHPTSWSWLLSGRAPVRKDTRRHTVLVHVSACANVFAFAGVSRAPSPAPRPGAPQGPLPQGPHADLSPRSTARAQTLTAASWGSPRAGSRGAALSSPDLYFYGRHMVSFPSPLAKSGTQSPKDPRNRAILFKVRLAAGPSRARPGSRAMLLSAARPGFQASRVTSDAEVMDTDDM